MFTIIGGDGREYGPATVQQIRIWLAEGRANLETKAKAAGTDEWRRLRDFLEFSPEERATAFGAESAAEPPVGVVVPAAELADRGVRLGAVMIDVIVTFLASLPGFLLLGTSFLVSVLNAVQSGQTDFTGVITPRMQLGANLLILGSVVVFVIQVWWLTTRGQTIGKRVLGIRIVRATDEGNPGFVYVVLLRNLVPMAISFIPLIGFIFSLTDILFIFRADRRCLHDLIAGTKVVKA
jgi:uncharacterized RDD family membrane protein YckC